MTASPDRLITALRSVETLRRVGRVAEARGNLIRVTGVNARIGEMCELRDPLTNQLLTAEVVGVERGMALLAPLGSLDGLSAAAEVVSKGVRVTVGAGDSLLGRMLDAQGNVVDGRTTPVGLTPVPVYRSAPNAATRPPIRKPFQTGVRALDAVLTVGEGQRLGIFAPAGSGTSTLLGMLSRSVADVNVIVLVGERGGEVREFVDHSLATEGLPKSVIVVATSDRPALERARAAYVGTAIAEYFRDRGKRVLLLVDSVTRFAKALRDIRLSAGEPLAYRGYPISVLSALAPLFERAGNGDRGSITAFYTVLLEEPESDPIREELQSILDGHVYLSSSLATSGHFPAIDVLASASRAMPRLVQPAYLRAVGLLRKHLQKHREIERSLQTGAYQRGADAEADEAVRNIPVVRKLLQQSPQQRSDFDESVTALTGMFK